jgi:cytochrome c-type biogenesis protein CcmH/NrfF
VLVEPPRHGVGLMVWIGPLAGLLLGAIALALWMRPGRRQRAEIPQPGSMTPAPAADWQLEVAQRELDELGRGLVK